MDYETNLLKVREKYPFDEWKTYVEDLEPYTEENCEAAKRIFDTLLSELIALGENVREEDKLQKFQYRSKFALSTKLTASWSGCHCSCST